MTAFISLGSTCAVAYQLQTNDLTTCRYPFDWVKTNDPESVIQSIKTHFTKFLIFKEKKFNVKTTFPMVDDEFPKVSEDFLYESNVYENEDGVQFYHDFDTSEREKQIGKVREKYERRIKRLYDVCASDKEIVFIRYETKAKNLMKINKIIECIDKYLIKNNKKYKLLVILHNPQKEKINFEPNDDRVKFFNDMSEFISWHMPSLGTILLNY